MAKAEHSMKVSLVVATGAHEGRVIPLTGPQFLIGRDQQCHLRPASQAISKLHCGVLIRDGKVYIKDFGSTNGTLVNDKIIQDAEVLIEDGATLRVGPLDFHVRVEVLAANPDGTPLPTDSPESAAALAAVKAAAAAVAASKAPPSRDTTPNPARKSGSAPQPGARPALAKPTAEQSPIAAPKPTGQEPPSSGSKESAPLTTASESNSDEDSMAAILLGMDDDGNGSVPEGSTVMDIPTPLAGGDGSQAGKPEEKKNDKKVVQTREEMSTAANDLLRKYMRRPR